MNYMTLSIIAMILFSLEVTISKVASNHIPSTTVALIRTIVAALVLSAYAIIESENHLSFSRFTAYASIAGVFLGLGFLLMFKSMETGPISVIAPIVGLSSVIAAVLGIVALHEPVTLTKIIGIVLACISMFIISR